MRRRLFWTIFAVASLTGLLVLLGATIATQRAAVDATYRELTNSAIEAVALIDDAVDNTGPRPEAIRDLFSVLEGDRVGPFLGRLRRTAGGSEIGVGVIPPDGVLVSNSPLFERLDLEEGPLLQGEIQRTRSDTDDLVVIAPTQLPVNDQADVTLLVALARDAPVIRLADQMRGLLLIIAGLGVAAAVLARLLSNQVARRLEPLAAAAHDLADGDLTARVPDLGDPELDDVATAFNEMARDLEQSREREREFILGVGHDLRTPLTTIRGYAEALEMGRFGPEEIERIGSVLGVQSRQLGRLIEDLTTLARLEQAEFGLREESVDVGAHVSEIAEGFRNRAEEVGVTLSVHAEPGIRLDTDPDRLGQIAQNLVENALRYTPETGEVSVSVTSEDGDALIEVSDTGTGIEPDDLPHIFDRHYVGSHRTVRKEGSGLGLSIVKGLVERMGGSVIAQSTVGKGTTITVRLPD